MEINNKQLLDKYTVSVTGDFRSFNKEYKKMKYDKKLALFDIEKLVQLDKKVKDEINPEAKLHNIDFSECEDVERKFFAKGSDLGFLHSSMLDMIQVRFTDGDYQINQFYRLKDKKYRHSFYYLAINECFELESEEKTLIKKEDV